jgi:hypothetical protein
MSMRMDNRAEEGILTGALQVCGHASQGEEERKHRPYLTVSLQYNVRHCPSYDTCLMLVHTASQQFTILHPQGSGCDVCTSLAGLSLKTSSIQRTKKTEPLCLS